MTWWFSAPSCTTSDVLSLTSRSKIEKWTAISVKNCENVKSVQRLSIVRWFIVAGGNIDKSNNEQKRNMSNRWFKDRKWWMIEVVIVLILILMIMMTMMMCAGWLRPNGPRVERTLRRNVPCLRPIIFLWFVIPDCNHCLCYHHRFHHHHHHHHHHHRRDPHHHHRDHHMKWKKVGAHVIRKSQWRNVA